MELQRPSPPVASAFQEHDPSQLVLPTVPNHDLGVGQKIQLPCIRSVLSPEFEQVIRRHDRTHSAYSIDSTNTLPRMEMGNDITPVRSIENDYPSTTPSPRNTLIFEERGRPKSVISVEDPDVRIAAEALSGLGHTSYLQSPKHSLHSSTATLTNDEAMALREEPEPLLQLFAQAHPWVGGTINSTVNGSMYAYNTTKYFSPGFIRHGAKLVERNIATPMVNTVGSVGRITGVEDGLRRYLGGRRPSELQPFLLPKDELRDVDMTGTTTSRRDSTETLPAYRASKPPSYREESSPSGLERERAESSRAAAATRTWPNNVAGQMLVMTSGLGVALSVTSRRSLQYCLSLLSQAIEHVATVMKALRMVLEQYDQARDSWRKQHSDLQKPGLQTDEDDEASRRLAQLIKQHCDDIWQTLKTVVNSVSTTAGGALPENARHFVRTQLMSLPQRWKIVSEQQNGEGETSQTAHRMIAFATEGLDMMNQVSQVVRATLDSAERWLDRVGRRDMAPALQEKDTEMVDAAP